MTALDTATTVDAAPLPTRAPPLESASLESLAQRHGTRFILATFTTLTGKPCSKLVPVAAADALLDGGAGFAGFAAGAMGQQPNDPDMTVIADPGSFAPLPFLKPGLAMVHCDPYVDGEPYPYAPRVILKQMLARARAEGFTLRAGAEVEYFLVRRGPDGTLQVADERDDAAQPCYDARGVTRMYDHLTAVADAMDALGWAPYASDHEDANGQFEQNFLVADALTTADRVVTLRFVIQMLAEQRDMTATFMPKPFADRTGNGLHLHLSLWRDEDPLFPSVPDGAADPRCHGLSPTAYAFVAGLLAHAPALQALIGPTVNSYKRTGVRTTRSGASWAPRLTPTYGGNDRTHFVRIPDGNRIELRGSDGSASPYLAMAGALGCGLDGIARSLNPDAAPDAVLPTTLLEAIQALEHDPVLCAVLDAADPTGGVSSYYAGLKREEFYAWHDAVSAWEIDRYLTAV
ncbi:MAG TPA: type III glutamate--ammonia ligase [Actinomycetota bacterium]|nr:type III glutamate--ammonia ligase [Actinomycetota bacterium]